MKKFTFCFVVLFLSLIVKAQNAYKLPANVTANDYLANTIIFKVKEDQRLYCTEQAVNVPALQKSFNAIGVISVQKKFKNENPPREKYNKEGLPMVDLSLIYECKFSPAIPLEKAITALLSTKTLAYAEPHFVPVTTYTPNDPLAVNTSTGQQHINRINAYNGWNISKGDTNMIIGITDTGTDFTHNDLQGNVKYNYADPVNSIDDDLDGYTDNFMGWDVGMNDNDPSWQGSAHGVHVCGIAAASTDNTVGIAGVGFKCRFLPVKIADASGALVAAYEGVKYAADQGCKVINCSWGGPGGGQYGQDIITYATINKDALVVCAAGNNGDETLFYPAAYDHAFAVANTMNTDILNFGSSRGYFVDVSAPGTSINSTWPPSSSYFQSTGTSMASPVVAGVAGIVRSFNPSYSALQAGERVKQTTDNISSLPYNSGIPDKIGTGRVNLFKALNDPLAPSVVYSGVVFKDNNDDVFNTNDTLRIGGLFTNYLAPTTALTATLIPKTPGVTALSNTINLGALAMMASVSNTATPFQFVLTGTFAPNAPLTFSLVMKDGSYTGRDVLSTTANADYYNISVNDISTTATSKGRIFYSADGQNQGIGFLYQGLNLVYDGGLMVGAHDTLVSDCVRGTGTTNEADFKIDYNIVHFDPGTGAASTLDTYANFDDSYAANPMGINVDQRTWAWNSTPDRKYVIWEYVIKNNSVNTYTALYAGICADWDVDAATYVNNKSAYDSPSKMGYTWCTDPGGKYAGIKLLTNSAPANFYALDNVAGGGGGIDVSGGYTTSKKYQTLSTSRLAAGNTTVTGNDVMNVMSSGPYTIAPGQQIIVAFALIAGDSLLDLQTSAAAAQVKYNSVASVISVQEINVGNNKVSIYPNPATDNIHVSLSDKEDTELSVYDQSGRLIFSENINSKTNINTQSWSRGIYFVKVRGKDSVAVTKIVLQ